MWWSSVGHTLVRITSFLGVFKSATSYLSMPDEYGLTVRGVLCPALLLHKDNYVKMLVESVVCCPLSKYGSLFASG